MYKYLSIILLLLVCNACKVKKSLTADEEQVNYNFPLDWIGHYEGQLEIFNQKNDTVLVDMALDIGHADNTGFFPWTISYNKEDVRPYGLEIINPDTGHCRIDEFNSIKLDAYYKAGHFTSRFDVMGSDLLIDYHRVKGGIEVLLFISQSKPVSITGNQVLGQDTIPEVKSFNMLAFQKAFLKKTEQ